MPPGRGGICRAMPTRCARVPRAMASHIASCRRSRSGNFEAVRGLAQRHGDSYALGIHPLCTGRGAATERPGTAGRGAGAHARTIRGWWRSARSAWTISCRASTRRDRSVFTRATCAGAPARVAGDPARAPLGRPVAQAPAPGRRARGIAHAFNGSAQQADEFVKLGFKLGFGGAVTFERAQQIRRLAAALPLSALVLETDAPDIPPQWLYRTGAAARGRSTRKAATSRPSCRASRRLWRSCAALRWKRWRWRRERNAVQALPRLAPLLAAAGNGGAESGSGDNPGSEGHSAPPCPKSISPIWATSATCTWAPNGSRARCCWTSRSRSSSNTCSA